MIGTVFELFLCQRRNIGRAAPGFKAPCFGQGVSEAEAHAQCGTAGLGREGVVLRRARAGVLLLNSQECLLYVHRVWQDVWVRALKLLLLPPFVLCCAVLCTPAVVLSWQSLESPTL